MHLKWRKLMIVSMMLVFACVLPDGAGAEMSGAQQAVRPADPQVERGASAERPRRRRRGRLFRLVRLPYKGVKATGKFINRGVRRIVKRRRPRRSY